MLKHRWVLMLMGTIALPALAMAQSSSTMSGRLRPGYGEPRQSAATAGKAEQQVMQADKERFAAMVKADIAALNRLLADDLTYTHSNALMQTKAEFIADLKSGAYDYVSVVPSDSDYKVRVDGTMAVINGVAAVNVIDHGKDLKIKIRYTNVHRHRAGQWQMVAWQATRFPQ
jgi:ketosteroid isomerase-like protein